MNPTPILFIKCIKNMPTMQTKKDQATMNVIWSYYYFPISFILIAEKLRDSSTLISALAVSRLVMQEMLFSADTLRIKKPSALVFSLLDIVLITKITLPLRIMSTTLFFSPSSILLALCTYNPSFSNRSAVPLVA